MTTTIRRLAFLALLSAWMAVPSGCAHAPPVVNAVVVCSGNTIPLALVEQVYGDIMAENWGDLVTNVVPLLQDGWADVVCIENALKTGHPEMVTHFEKLKAGHVELRVVAESSKPDPGDRLPGASPAAGGAPRVPAAGPKMFSYAGESVWHAQAACRATCAGGESNGSPGAPCLCLRGRSWVVATR